jgi:DNA-binding GntR family transcriptional regulator
MKPLFVSWRARVQRNPRIARPRSASFPDPIVCNRMPHSALAEGLGHVLSRSQPMRAAISRSRTSISDIVVAIENDIVGGVFAPEQRLDERQLSLRFGVSRTPIREALSRMAASGLVVSRPNQGVFVARLTLAQFLQQFEVMSGLEGMAAELCARRASPADKARLIEIHQRAGEAAAKADTAAYVQHNLDFHNAIYKGSQNEFLEHQVIAIRRRLEPYRRSIFGLSGRLEESHHEHGIVAESILASDAATAQKVMLLHLNMHRPSFADYLLHLTKVLPAA